MPGFLTGDATHLEVVWNRISHTFKEALQPASTAS